MTAHLGNQIAAARASSDPSHVERWERLRADIGHYVGGGRITWNLMRWLDPHRYEHWELRSVRPKPSLRVFGRFAEPDVFVGTHAVERKPLKAKWSLEWELEKLTCEERWKEALGDCAPFAAAAFENYFTENATHQVEVPS